MNILIKYFAIILICVVTTQNIDNWIVTNKPNIVQVTESNKSALFIGDSFTSNHIWGWQILVSKNFKFYSVNLSEPGRQTKWMSSTLRSTNISTYDYCFIYGGVNDIFSEVNPSVAVQNVLDMVYFCINNKVQPIVLLGYDPEKSISNQLANSTKIKNYKYFQDTLNYRLPDNVIRVKFDLESEDCFDWICHMTKSGHEKIAKEVIISLAN